MSSPELSSFGVGEIVEALVNKRRVVAAVVGFFAVVALALALIAPPRYVSVASFVPEGASGGNNPLSQLAGQFDLNLGSAGGSSSPEFYAALLRSEPVRESIARMSLPLESGEEIQLVEWATKKKKGTPSERLEATIRWLGDGTSAISVDARTSIVTVRVRTTDPVLSAGIAEAFVAEVDRFDLSQRRTSAFAEGAFLRTRIEGLEEEIRIQEDTLRRFLETNRRISEDAPRLILQRNRLQEDLQRLLGTRASLITALNEAEIREVRDTPTISRIQQPRVPAKPEPRRLLGRLFIGLLVGCVVGVPTAGVAVLWERRPGRVGS